MLAASTVFQQMVEGVSHVYEWRLEIDLPGGIYPNVTLAATAIEIDASITTDMAEGTRLEEGYASQQATFALTGPIDKTDATKTAAWLFGRYSTTSPLYRSDVFMIPVRIYLGLYTANCGGVPEMLRKFTGFVEDYTQDADGNVSFTCLDGRQMLRSTASVPNAITTPPFNAGLTSEFAIDALLRAATGGAVSSWPKQRPSCVLAVGLRSSVWPEIGTLSTTYSQPTPKFAASAYGSGLAGTAGYYTGSGETLYGLAGSFKQNLFVEFWLTGGDVASPFAQVSVGVGVRSDASVTGVTVSVNSFGVYLYLNGSTKASIAGALSAGVHYVALRLDYSGVTGSGLSMAGTVVGTLWVDSTSTPVSFAADYTIVDPVQSLNFAGVVAGNGTAVFGVQVTGESSPTLNSGFTPGAVLDPSLNPLQLVPDLTGDPWQTIQQAAQAELGIFRFDESTGQFRFINRNTLNTASISRTISALSSLETIGGVESTAASVVNRAQIGHAGWTFATTASTIYSLDTVTKVPRHSTVPITATLDNPAVNIDGGIAKLPDGGTDVTQSWVRVSRDVNGLNAHPGGLVFAVTQSQPTTVTINATNTSNIDAWLVSPSSNTDMAPGTPVLWLAGTVVTQQSEIVSDYQWPTPELGGAASSRFGEVAYTSTGNGWNQDGPTADLMAQVIVEESYLPRPNFTGLSIMPDARLQISDKVLIDDTARTGVLEYARIFGYTITWSADAGGDTYEMTVDGRALANPGEWLLGVTGRSELALTTYL